MKKFPLYMGCCLIVQALTGFFLMLLFLIRGKKNSAGIFLTTGILSGIIGSIVVYRQIRERLEDRRLSEVIDEILSSEDDWVEKTPIPLDETANEVEFQNT